RAAGGGAPPGRRADARSLGRGLAAPGRGRRHGLRLAERPAVGGARAAARLGQRSLPFRSPRTADPRARQRVTAVGRWRAGASRAARAMVPTVPRITSQDHANRITPVSPSTSKTRLTSAIRTIAVTFARLARTGVSSPRRKTPSRDPKVTPPILKA